MLIDAVDQRAIKIEQEAGVDAHGYPSCRRANLSYEPRPVQKVAPGLVTTGNESSATNVAD
jgi:hypothetical protein